MRRIGREICLTIDYRVLGYQHTGVALQIDYTQPNEAEKVKYAKNDGNIL